MRRYMDEYLDAVCSRVKWKKARSVIRRELDDHLVDQYDAYMAAGDGEEEAAQKAVASMGAAEAIGDELNAVYQPKIDRQLLVMTAVVLAAGVVGQLLYRLTVGFDSAGGYAVIGMLCGCAAMVACALFDVNRIKERPWLWFFGYLALVAVTHSMSSDLNGKRISVFNTPLHVGYLTMLAPVVWAAVIHKMKDRGTIGVLLCGAAFLLPLYAEGTIPSFHGSVLIAVTGLVMLGYAIKVGWFGKNKLAYALVVYAPTLAVVAAFICMMPERMRAWFVPQPNSRYTYGYWGSQLQEMLSHSAMVGTGSPWESFSLLNQNGQLADYKLTVLIYGYGWIILPILAALILGVGYCVVRVIRKQNTMFGKLLGVSAAMLLLMQCVIAILSALGFYVSADYPLPFLGGNYTWLYNLLLVGVLLSLSRHNCLTSETTGEGRSARRRTRLFEIDDGKLIIYLR